MSHPGRIQTIILPAP